MGVILSTHYSALTIMFCSHCGNEVKVQAANCPYCEKPLGKSLAAAKSTRSCFTLVFSLLTIAMFAAAAYFVFPQLRQILFHSRDQPQPQESSTPARNAASDELQLRVAVSKLCDDAGKSEPS